jgi:D-alanyl-D-alanine carboxypeptidase
MKRNSISVSLIALTLLFFTQCAKRETDKSVVSCKAALDQDYFLKDSSIAHPKNAAYTKLITDLTDKGLPGISILISDNKGTWFKAGGYADIGNEVKMENCHIGKVASVTKLFTAVMIYQLADEGKLSLDDPISKYIDAAHIKRIKNSELCKVRNLLDHSSGIYDVVFDAEFILYTFNNLDKEKSYEKLLAFAYDKEPAFAFGTKRSYNQTLNHVLLAMIVNKVSGEDQVTMMRNKIFTPLNMNNSYLRPQNDLPWQYIAKGYFDYRKEGVLQDLTPLFTGDGRGFTGVYMNVFDMKRFSDGLFKNKTLINSASYNSMVEIPSLDSTMACAGGCRAMRIQSNGINYDWYGHPGGEVNYAAGIFYCPQLDATIAFNVNYGVAFTDMGKHTDAYYDFRKKVFEEVCK